MQRCLYVQVLSISVYLILERPAEAGYVVYAAATTVVDDEAT